MGRYGLDPVSSRGSKPPRALGFCCGRVGPQLHSVSRLQRLAAGRHSSHCLLPHVGLNTLRAARLPTPAHVVPASTLLVGTGLQVMGSSQGHLGAVTAGPYSKLLMGSDRAIKCPHPRRAAQQGTVEEGAGSARG